MIKLQIIAVLSVLLNQRLLCSLGSAETASKENVNEPC